MRTIAWSLGLAVFATTASSALALKVANPTQPPIQRAVAADAIVVGKVTAIEDQPVEAVPNANTKEKVKFHIGIIKVQEAISGIKGLTHIKVGFLPPPVAADPNNGQVPPPVKLQPAPGLVRPIARPAIARIPAFQPPSLKKDQEGIFFLQKHPTESFYIMTIQAPPIDLTDRNYKQSRALIDQTLTTVADPIKALKQKNAADRYVAAAALLAKYRTYPQGVRKVEQEPISKEETQLIIQAITEADWKKLDANTPMAQSLMYQLGLTPNDGWQVPRFNGQGNYNDFLKGVFTKWAAGEGKNFTIKRYVEKQ